MLVPLVLSGGAGTRLWPLSRRLYPKQLQSLVGTETLLVQTIARTDGLAGVVAPVVVCNVSHGARVQAQLRAAGRDGATVVLEPMGRNTAPAVALGALQALANATPEDPDPLLLVLPADHVVLDVPAFEAAVAVAEPLAQAGRLVTFGVVPDSPHTGYGYIRAASPGASAAVECFVEKPDVGTAERLLAEGGYTWNSGMFVFGARAYLEQLAHHAPAMLQACTDAMAGATGDEGRVHPQADAFGRCPADSIDYAVMEKTSRASVVSLRAGWSDIGSWAALHQVGPHDDAGNATSGDVVAQDCQGCLVHAGHRLVAAVGLRDIVVVESDDAVLVAPRERSEDVKQIVDTLAAAGRAEVQHGRTRVWPWGSTRALDTPWVAATSAMVVDAGRRTDAQHYVGGSRRVMVTSGGGRLEQPGQSPRTLEVGDSIALPPGASHVLVAGPDQALHVLCVDTSQ